MISNSIDKPMSNSRALSNEDTRIIFQCMVDIVHVFTTFMVTTRDHLLSNDRSLSERSIMSMCFKNKTNLTVYSGNRNVSEGLAASMPNTEEDIKHAIIEKQTKEFDIFNKIFDISVYATFPIIFVSMIAFMAIVIAGAEMAVPFLAVVGSIFLSLVITQALSLGMLYHSHKNLDKDITNSIKKQIDKFKETAETLSQNVANNIPSNDNNQDSYRTLGVLTKCQPMNLVIAIRDINLAKIRKGIDEYNYLLRNAEVPMLTALNLMDSELVNSLIIMLGSLFLNEDNRDFAHESYENYIKAVKDDILTLLNSSASDILVALVDSLSGKDINSQTSNTSCDLLKTVIIGKLEGITSA
jgi:uncharacterized membrane protein (DUF485 family)